ncbi:aspartyl-phosphate phosphatase Spo0E family protein [Lentibacillus sp. JNUCC-1]|uniref:aspartyl-phosphate phosphatase Spo0E family protein n=1 Tax=Lentibacillus sp. JNUCC-1 TaxID=2654513 RepID=UPI0012E83809|nr:aspartyl-phosphate phosphatase Spo0E family protein [Lentibacillus sp. JNUCC-1]
MDISTLAEKIASARQEMIALGLQYGLNSAPVLEASEYLDGLLNEYRSLITEKEKASDTIKHQ